MTGDDNSDWIIAVAPPQNRANGPFIKWCCSPREICSNFIVRKRFNKNLPKGKWSVYHLIIFQSIGSKWQANDRINTHHHFPLLYACELAKQSTSLTSSENLVMKHPPRIQFLNFLVVLLREDSLKVESDCNVDNTVGIGDSADEAEHQLQSLHHQGGQQVGEWAYKKCNFDQ